MPSVEAKVAVCRLADTEGSVVCRPRSMLMQPSSHQGSRQGGGRGGGWYQDQMMGCPRVQHRVVRCRHGWSWQIPETLFVLLANAVARLARVIIALLHAPLDLL